MHALAESIRDFLGAAQNVLDARKHLAATMSWLCRAQDAGSGGGVARMYHLRTGWGHEYPETTGYIIPTFFDYARFSGREEFHERAIRMAQWECRIQMPEGAVMGGTAERKPTPAIFNTGQVLFGWCAAYEQTKECGFLEAARRAGDYLLSQQDGDGLWRRNLSNYCNAGTETYAYNVRSAWGLLRLAETTGEGRYRIAAKRNVSAVIGMAHENGWLENNCLTDPLQPLLHTIAYTYQGLVECGALLGDGQAIALVETGSRFLRRRLEQNGKLHGRYDSSWKPAVRSRCLTGEAQLATTWFRLARFTNDDAWRAAAERLTAMVCKTQRLTAPSEIAGGVKGSYPIYGEYLPYEYVNWGAKFHADALMLMLGYSAAGSHG